MFWPKLSKLLVSKGSEYESSKRKDDSMNELTPILRFPGYSITRDERVCNTKTGKWLWIRIDKSIGYKVVDLCRDGRVFVVPVYRLLLETFVGPCPKGMECRHLDGNRLNDDLSNLRWGTRYENILDRIEHNVGAPPRKHGNKLNEYKVSWIKQLLDTGRFTQRKIARVFGVSQVAISHIKTGERWSWVV